jgi:hypothetical protein
MYELIPIFAGVFAGLAAGRFASGTSRWVIIVATALVAGSFAAVLSGEVAESWGFLFWDITQALAAGVLALIAITRLAHQRTGDSGPGQS